MDTLKHYLTAENIGVAFLAWSALVAGGLSTVASLINVCTPYPKVETWLHSVQDRLAYLQHFDSSPTLLGILQWPIFQRSNPPAVVGQQLAKGFVRLLVLNLFCVLALVVIASCAWFQKNGGPALLQCTEQQATTALGEVGNILITDSAEWQTELQAEGVAVGTDVLLCAIQKWISSQDIAGAAALDPRVVTGIQRGQSYLKQSGKTVVVQ